MKRGLRLLAFFIAIILLVGCQQKIVCNKPYILVGTQCCLDKDSNSICDKDEAKSEPPQEAGEEDVLELFIAERVIDGDTFALNSGEKVRLIGIDTPETNEPYYEEAKKRLSELIMNKSLKLENDISDKDMYDRLLRYVYNDEMLFVNLILVQEGYARAYPYPSDTKHKTEFANAEAMAKSQGLGIWAKVEEKEPKIIEPKKTATSGYICSYNAYNCDDFKTHAEAQAAFEACGGVSNDIHLLDRDRDDVACETLPISR